MILAAIITRIYALIVGCWLLYKFERLHASRTMRVVFYRLSSRLKSNFWFNEIEQNRDKSSNAKRRRNKKRLMMTNRERMRNGWKMPIIKKRRKLCVFSLCTRPSSLFHSFFTIFFKKYFWHFPLVWYLAATFFHSL